MAVNNLQTANMAQSDKIFAITYQFDTPQLLVLEQKFAEPHSRVASHSADQ